MFRRVRFTAYQSPERDGKRRHRPMTLETLECRHVLSSITGVSPVPVTHHTTLTNDTTVNWLSSGDANQDLRFDQTDLVQVLHSGKYLTGEPATWAEGDWNGAPVGTVGNPSQGDGVFDQLDLIAALQWGAYRGGHHAALSPVDGVRGDEQTSIIYNPATGEIIVDAPRSGELTSINIDSASGIFHGGSNLFRASFGSSFGSFSWGNVARPELTNDFIRNDLTVVGSMVGGGGLGSVDLATSSCSSIGRHSSTAEIARYGSSEELEQYLIKRPERPSPFDPPLDVFRGGGSFDGSLGGSFDNDLATGRPPTHSNTNTRVEGVDEADLVETDGKYLYILSGDTLVVADAWPRDDPRVVSRWHIDGNALGQYLIGDRLAIVSQAERVKVSVLDISNRNTPAVVQTTEFDGTYLESRAIGDFVYVVSGDRFGSTGQESLPYRGGGDILERGLPHFSSFDAHGNLAGTGLLTDPVNIYKPVLSNDSDLVSVVVFDVTSDVPGHRSSLSVPSMPSARVYASHDSFYLVHPGCGVSSESEASAVLKLDIVQDGAGVELSAVGDVPGRPLDSFSIDEYEDHLRIATAEGFGRDMQNRVYVMEHASQELRVVGQTESMATGERIRSVRFMQETGYVVTFPEETAPRFTTPRFIDPLFTIDLSDPTDPTVIGELEIPGFSNYLHPVEDGYLIGLGRDADQRTGRAQRLQLSLFDVSDLSRPFQADRYEFELPVWANTEAIEDHHAIAYYPEYHILALPVTDPAAEISVDRNGDGVADISENRPRTDLWVFHIDLPGEGDPGAGIEFLGRIEQSGAVRRSVRIEDYLYSISNNSIEVYPMTVRPTDPIAELYFGQEHAGIHVYGADKTDPNVQAAAETPEDAAPQVLDVRLRSSTWGNEFIDYLDLRAGNAPRDIVPFDRIDQIRVTFSEDIFGVPGMRLRGADVSQYTATDYVYDPESMTGIWTFGEPIDTDTVTLRVYGVVDQDGNRLDGDSDGRPGGSFRHQFSTLPGDLNADGYVDRSDVALLAPPQRVVGLGEAAYVASRDLDGSGTIDASDRSAVLNRMGSLLPSRLPRLRPGDSDGDGVFGQLDLVRVLQSAKYMTGQAASWADGDWNLDGAFDQHDAVLALVNGFTPGRTQNAMADDVFAAMSGPA